MSVEEKGRDSEKRDGDILTAFFPTPRFFSIGTIGVTPPNDIRIGVCVGCWAGWSGWSGLVPVEPVGRRSGIPKTMGTTFYPEKKPIAGGGIYPHNHT
jgi:hypothetical protein